MVGVSALYAIIGNVSMDEMWSVVGNKGPPRRLWHTIEYHTGAV